MNVMRCYFCAMIALLFSVTCSEAQLPPHACTQSQSEQFACAAPASASPEAITANEHGLELDPRYVCRTTGLLDAAIEG